MSEQTQVPSQKIDPLVAVELLINANKLDDAERLVATMNTDDTTRYTLRGVIALRRKDMDAGHRLLSKAVELAPGNALAQGHLGSLLITQKRFKEAVPLLDRALKRYPDNYQFVVNKALLMNELHEHESLVEFLQPRLALGEKRGSTLHTILISALRSLYRLDEARQLLEETLPQFPDSGELVKLRADLLSEVDPAKAASAYEVMHAEGSLGKASAWNSSFVDLRNRNWKRGLENYEFGLDGEIGTIGRPLPDVVKQLPRVERLADLDPDRWLVMSGEQGIGDQVFFMSVFTELLERHKKVVVVADQRMLPVIGRSFPQASMLRFGSAHLLRDRAEVQGYMPMGSLLREFRAETVDFLAGRRPYLVPEPSITKKYRDSLRKHSPGKPVVGISWKGGFWERQQKGKTLELSAWEPLLSREDATFVSLQYGDTTAEQAFCREKGFNVKFIKGMDFKKDLDGWFSVICACDLIVSISTAMVHFAGAAGKKVYVLLSDRQQPFVWGLEETRSIVYPDVHLVRMASGSAPVEYFRHLNRIFK